MSAYDTDPAYNPEPLDEDCELEQAGSGYPEDVPLEDEDEEGDDTDA